MAARESTLRVALQACLAVSRWNATSLAHCAQTDAPHVDAMAGYTKDPWGTTSRSCAVAGSLAATGPQPRSGKTCGTGRWCLLELRP